MISKMYAMKPINENFHIISESTSMYKCKSYYNDSDSSSPLEAPGQAAPAVIIQKVFSKIRYYRKIKGWKSLSYFFS